MLSLFAWLILLAAMGILAVQVFHFDWVHSPDAFLALPPSQQAAIAVVALMALALVAYAVRQSHRLARHEKRVRALRGGLSGNQQAISLAGGSQKDFDAAVAHLAGSDPEDAISSLHKQLSEAEQRAALQRGRNEAVDMQERLDDIRRRQQALREQIGEVAEKRRLIEPVFEELKDRQRQLERSLDKIETDDQNNSLADRMKELDQKVAQIHARHKALQDSFTTLHRFKEEMTKSNADLVPLQAPDAGIKTLLGQLQVHRDQLAKAIEELESSDGERLSARVEALDSGKKDAEQRIIRLEGSHTMLDTIRRDFLELRRRQDDLAVGFAEVETDSSGKSLGDRLAALDEFSASARVRLRTLQESLTTLSRYRKDLVKSQEDLTPLRAPEEGINALIDELHSRRVQLMQALDELESSNGEKLSLRVEALTEAKRTTEQRIAQVHEYFVRLDSIKTDIAGTFANINSALNKPG
jgi:predicted  nucleic acid-binding Zn-ribbon protein